LPDSQEYYHHYAVVHLKDNNEKLEGLEFVFIELPKFKSKNITEKRLQILWLRFLTEINEQSEKISEELLENPDIKQAVSFVYEASLTKEEKLLYDKNWDRISSERTILNEARAEAEAKGKAVGRFEGRAEGEKIGMNKVAKNAKEMGMPIKDISTLTGLSDDEIMKL